jgi:CPA1 family monovalent cation:H+ antiporter
VRPLGLVVTQLLPGALRTRLGGAQDAEDEEAADPQHRPHRPAEQPLAWREVAVLSWTGTRGVVTLAAVSTLPVATHGGAPFPARDLLVFCAYVVVLVTLVGQGATFAPLVRRLGVLADRAHVSRVRNEARLAAVRAALDALEDTAAEREVPDDVTAEVRGRLERREELLEHRGSALQDAAPGEEVPVPPRTAAASRLTAGLIDVQREELVRWRDAGRLSDEGLRELEAELDRREDLLPPAVRA